MSWADDGETVIKSRIYASEKELDEFYARLKLTPCPHCNQTGSLIKHGFLRGYDHENQLQKTTRAARVFCSNRNRASGCGRTFSLSMAERIRRLFLGAESLWLFLQLVVSTGNKLAAFRQLDGPLSDSAPYRIWKRFVRAQAAIRAALIPLCSPPVVPSGNPESVTLAHLQKAFGGQSLNPIAAFQAKLQTFFL